MTKRTSSVRRLLLALPVFLLGCANQKPPSGGPPDLTPPGILATSPRSNETQVSTQHLAIEFDKYVDQRSLQESIFISPSVGELEFEWDGKSVDVTMAKPLQSNTTYVVTIGTDVVDRKQNHLAQSYTFAFSTGTAIDRGGIEGRIIPKQDGDGATGIMIFAYRLDGRDPDTLNPVKIPPDYISQTGKEGIFALRHIALGAYRLLAVRDEYRNLLYDPETDDFGVAAGPVVLTPADTLVKGIVMQMSKEDTTAPRLIRTESKDRRHVSVQFSEAMSWEGMVPGAFAIRDTVSKKPLDVTSLYAAPQTTGSYVLVTAPQDSATGYELTAVGVRDTTGNVISPAANALRFGGSAIPDTLRTKFVSFSIPDSARNVDRRPELRFRFSDMIARPVDPKLFHLRDATGHEIPLAFEWADGASFILRAAAPLGGPTWHTVTAPLGSMLDHLGKPVADSTRKFSFESLDPEMLGSIEGRVEGWKRVPGSGRLFIVAKPLGTKPLPPLVVQADATGAFIFPEVADGKYVLQAFEDVDGDGAYSPGRPWPYRKSEPLGPYSDTLKVRARWPLEGVTVRLTDSPALTR
jgi:hypothetical protein